MDMQLYIMEILKDLGVPISFVARGETQLPLVVFNITQEKGNRFWEDEEVEIKYGISINVFSRNNFTNIKNEIIQRMTRAGFIRRDIPACIYLEDIQVYNQPIQFDYYYEKN